ncbi:MAG: metallophosphoesterase [Kofleriaceae bacterium]
MSVLFRALVATLFLASCAAGTRDWEDTSTSMLLTGPYVLLTGPNDAIVAFRHTSHKHATVEWQTETGEHGSQPARRDGDQFSARFKGLPRGPVINYRIMMHDKVAGAGSFRVGPAPNETTARFAVFGDTRTNHQVHRSVIEAVSKEKLDFFIHTGDMLERGGKPEQWIIYFQIERPLMEKAPILPAIGNHDLGNRGYYTKYFFLDEWTLGKSYYVTDWGRLRIISLDVTIVCEDRCAQYEFVRKALADGAAADKIMVMFLHHPPYSSGAHGSDLQLRGVLAPLAKKYGVELVITGHDHDYERTKSIDGTTYIVSGSAGAPIRPIRPHEFTASARTEPHYVLVDVDGDKLSLRAINLRGEVFDSASLPLNPPGGPPPK